MAAERFDVELAPIPAMEAALDKIADAGFPRSEHIVAAQRILVAALAQERRADALRLRRIGEGPFCSCCGQRKPEAS